MEDSVLTVVLIEQNRLLIVIMPRGTVTKHSECRVREYTLLPHLKLSHNEVSGSGLPRADGL